MLSCIYWGALFGGAITSVLFNIPGEPWSVATTFDGYPMARNGKAGEALTAAFTSSFVGAFIANVMTTFLAPLVAKFALQFGPPEFFSVYLLTFCSFVGMNKGSPFKTISAMMLGFALAAVGMDTVTGQLRLTFGHAELMRGFDFLIAVIGLFGIGEILLSMEEGLAFQGAAAKIRGKVVLETWKQLPKYWAASLRSCLIGCWMGIWINQSARRAFLVKLPKDLPSDDALIQGFEDQYLGYIPKKIGREPLKELAILHRKINDLEKYKRQLGTGVFALMGSAGMSVFSKRELISLLSEQAKSLRPVYAMIDERLEHLKSELAQTNQIFKRGNDACYERRLVA